MVPYHEKACSCEATVCRPYLLATQEIYCGERNTVDNLPTNCNEWSHVPISTAPSMPRGSRLGCTLCDLRVAVALYIYPGYFCVSESEICSVFVSSFFKYCSVSVNPRGSSHRSIGSPRGVLLGFNYRDLKTCPT